MTAKLLASEVVFEETSGTTPVVPSQATAVTGLVGVTQRGPIGRAVVSQSFDEWRKIWGDYIANSDAILAAKSYFDNGGTELHTVRVVHCSDASDPTTRTSAQASLDLQTAAAAASAGTVQSSLSGPWNITPGHTLQIKVDGGGTLTVTVSATQASRTSGGSAPFGLVNGQTLTVAIDGGGAATVTFSTAMFVDITQATALEVAAVINARFAALGIGAVASVSGGQVVITSNKKGTGSSVNVTGGSANAVLTFTTGAVAGSGNVANAAAVTTTELAGLVNTALGVAGTATTPGGYLKITSATTGGASSVQVLGSSTALAEVGFDSAVHAGNSGAAVGRFRAKGKTDGAYANAITLVVAAATSGAATAFNLQVVKSGATAETWPNLSVDPNDARYALTIVNDVNTGSDLIVLEDLLLSSALTPAAGTFGPLTGGDDGLAGLVDADYVGGTGANGDVGLRALDAVSTLSILIVPGRATAAVHNAMITYCEITRAGRVFAILDPPRNQSATQVIAYVKSTAALQRLSEYGAIYWPNVLVDNPSTAAYGSAVTLVAPPSGAIAGLYSRVDASGPAGVFQAPAGVQNGRLLGVRGVEMPEVLKKAKRELVFPELINPISSEPGYSFTFLDGARTLKDVGAAFPTIGERRGVIFVEATLTIALTAIRHRNITAALLNEAKRDAVAFLLNLTRNEAFASTTPSQAFTVDFGSGLNTPSTKAARQVHGRLGLATAKPAEFVIVQVSPDTRALDAELAAAAGA